MTLHIRSALLVGCILLSAACGVSKQKIDSAGKGLEGSSWRLVQFVGGDETRLSPDDKSIYTVSFVSDKDVEVRFDCNRGRGSWRSTETTLIEFGPLATTRAMCANPALHDHLVRQWPYIRSYVLKGGHLFLSLMADGGVYEFEPVEAER